MGDNPSKERRNTLAFCPEGEEEEEITTCECGYANGHPPRPNIDLRDQTASSLDCGTFVLSEQQKMSLTHVHLFVAQSNRKCLKRNQQTTEACFY